MAVTSSLPVMPSLLSISCSTGNPCVSHPKRRATWNPLTCACRVTISWFFSNQYIAYALHLYITSLLWFQQVGAHSGEALLQKVARHRRNILAYPPKVSSWFGTHRCLSRIEWLFPPPLRNRMRRKLVILEWIWPELIQGWLTIMLRKWHSVPESKDNNPMASFPANFLNSNIDRVSAYLDMID